MLSDQHYATALAEHRRRSNRFALLTLTVIAVIGAASFHSRLLDAQRMAEGVPSLLYLVGEMRPPNFSEAQSWLGTLLDTLAMSIAGAALAVAFSIPLSFLAAKNISPHPLVYHLARGLLNGLRAVPELIMGIVFVAAVGFGALPGVLALGLHSIGMVGKFFAEAIEHVDEAPVEAARAAGAKP